MYCPALFSPEFRQESGKLPDFVSCYARNARLVRTQKSTADITAVLEEVVSFVMLFYAFAFHRPCRLQ